MYYYVLNEQNTITNSIVLSESEDPAVFGAVADERVFDIGETYTPLPTETDDLASMLIDHEYRLTLLELGIEGSEP